MATIELTHKQILEYVVAGIKNGNYQAALNLAQDCIDEMDAQLKTIPSPDSDIKSNGIL